MERGIPDSHVLGVIDVERVAVGIDDNPVDCPVIHAGAENAEMSSVLDGKIAKHNIVAILECDGLVGWSRGPGEVPRGDFAHVVHDKDLDRVAAGVDIASVNQARAGDHDVFEADAPNQTVLPVAVPLVLKTYVEVHLGGVVVPAILAWAGSLYGGLNDRVVRFKMQADVAL